MNYEEFFKMRLEPFANVPDTRFFYQSQQHKMALLRLMHSADRMRGFALLIGEIGTGKTTVARKLLSYLAKNQQFKTGLIVLTHENFSDEWLFRRIANLTGIPESEDISKDPMSIITKQLLKLNKEGRKTVIIIDEANKISDAKVIEQIRGFLNLELNEKRLITFVLIGVPELEKHLMQNDSIKQRVSTRSFLRALSKEQTEGYIKHRLNIAGADIGIFTVDAVDMVYEYSAGRPRLINSICDNALLEAAFMEQLPINRQIIEDVCESLGLQRQLTGYKREL